MESHVENEKVDKIMLKFMRENSKMAGKQPQDRVTVWSQATGYPGMLGFHSEIGRIAHARNTTADNELKSSVSALETIHRKDLQNLNFSKKNVELSMVAYSDKMRRISSDKLFDRLKVQHDIENLRNCASMSRLYDDAIKNVSSEVKYSVPLNQVSSASSPINRETSTQERSTLFLTDENKPCNVESNRNPSETVKRSRKIATVSTPNIIYQQDKLQVPELIEDTKPSINSENVATQEQKPTELKTNTCSDWPPELVRSSVVISPFPELNNSKSNQDKHLPNTNKTKSAKELPKKQLNRKPENQIPKHQTDAESKQPASPKTHKERKRKVSKKTPRECRNSEDSSQIAPTEEISTGRKKSVEEDGGIQDTIIKFVNVSNMTQKVKGCDPNRSRSVSVPNSPRIIQHMGTKPLVDCNGNEVTLKSVLRHRKTSDITYLVKKSVQFQLPELDKSHFEMYKHVKCEQSPSTITIIRMD